MNIALKIELKKPEGIFYFATILIQQLIISWRVEPLHSQYVMNLTPVLSQTAVVLNKNIGQYATKIEEYLMFSIYGNNTTFKIPRDHSKLIQAIFWSLF